MDSRNSKDTNISWKTISITGKYSYSDVDADAARLGIDRSKLLQMTYEMWKSYQDRNKFLNVLKNVIPFVYLIISLALIAFLVGGIL